MRFLCLAFTLLVLSGCGAIYFSPNVAEDDPNIDIIALTPQTVISANAQRYVPKSLPAVFSRTAEGGGALRGAGATPDPVTDLPRRPVSVPVNLPPSAPDTPYEIGVGDVVLLATPSVGSTVEELSGLLAAQNRRQGYTVQDDGAITIPDIGRVQLAGLTLDVAEAEIFQRLLENQIDPAFSIEISEFNSKRVSVGGAVRQSQVVPITLTGVTLEEALAAAGGITTQETADTILRLYRDGVLYQVPMEIYLNTPEVQKTRLQAGDSIFVDISYALDQAQAYFAEQIALAQFKQTARIQALNELNAEISLRRAALDEVRSNFELRQAVDGIARDYIYLTGEVRKPGRFTLPFERQASLADALFDTGGVIQKTADPRHIYVLRAQGSGRIHAYNLNVEKVSNMVFATQFQMRPNDIIFVAEQPVTRWARVVDQLSPTLLNTSFSAGIVGTQ